MALIALRIKIHRQFAVQVSIDGLLRKHRFGEQCRLVVAAMDASEHNRPE